MFCCSCIHELIIDISKLIKLYFYQKLLGFEKARQSKLCVRERKRESQMQNVLMCVWNMMEVTCPPHWGCHTCLLAWHKTDSQSALILLQNRQLSQESRKDTFNQGHRDFHGRNRDESFLFDAEKYLRMLTNTQSAVMQMPPHSFFLHLPCNNTTDASFFIQSCQKLCCPSPNELHNSRKA